VRPIRIRVSGGCCVAADGKRREGSESTIVKSTPRLADPRGRPGPGQRSPPVRHAEISVAPKGSGVGNFRPKGCRLCRCEGGGYSGPRSTCCRIRSRTRWRDLYRALRVPATRGEGYDAKEHADHQYRRVTPATQDSEGHKALGVAMFAMKRVNRSASPSRRSGILPDHGLNGGCPSSWVKHTGTQMR